MSEMLDRAATALGRRAADVWHEKDCAAIVIAAMREPTEAMIEAACTQERIMPDDARGAWQAMIDEALRD